MEPGYADGWVNVGPRAHPGRQPGRRRGHPAQGARVDPKLAKTHFFLGSVAEGAGAATTRRSSHLRAAAAQYPRDRVVRNQLGRVLFLKRAVRARPSPSCSRCCSRPRGPAGALQPHALPTRAWATRRRRRARGAALPSASRPTSRRRPSPGQYRQLHPDDNNERQSIHEHGTRRPGRSRPRPDGPQEYAEENPREATAGASPSDQPVRPPPPPAVTFTDVTAPAGIKFRHVERRFRQEVPAGDHGLRRRVLRRRRRRLARTSSSSTPSAGRASQARNRAPRSTATTATGRSRTPPRGSGLDVADLRHGRRRRRLRQRRPRGRLRDRARRQPPLPQPRAADVRRRDRRGGRWRTAASAPAPPSSTSTRTASSTCSSATTWSGRSTRTSSARSTARTKSYCTPESYKGQQPASLPQPGRRHLRGRHAEGRPRSTRSRRRSASPSSTTTATAGPTSSSPTTPSPTSSTATAATAPSPTSAVAAGVAFSEAGVARAGMGVDAADYDGSGRPSLVIGNFSNEMLALYHNEGTRPVHRRGARLGRRTRHPADASASAASSSTTTSTGASTSSRPTATSPTTSAGCSRRCSYAQPPHLFRNPGGKAFEDARPDGWAPPSAQPMVARGAAYGDYDGDGDLDLVVTANNGAGRAPAQRRRQPQPLHPRAARRQALEPRRHRREGRRSPRRDGRKQWAHGEDRVELLLAERAAGDLRPGRGARRRRRWKWRGRAASWTRCRTCRRAASSPSRKARAPLRPCRFRPAARCAR